MSSTLALVDITSTRSDVSSRATSSVESRTLREYAASTYSPDLPQGGGNEVLALRRSALVAMVIQLNLIGAMGSVITGILTIGLPKIAQDLDLERELLNWPLLVYTLTSGSCLIAAGALADVVGSRPINLLGSLLLGTFMLACGLARTGIELIIFRAICGVAAAMFMPTSVSLTSENIPSGRMRNVSFSLLAVSQVLGFMSGLVLGGVLVDTVGWRTGFYIGGSLTLLNTIIGWYTIPRKPVAHTSGSMWIRVRKDVDWTGAAIASAGLAMLAYVLAMITTSTRYIYQAHVIALLVLSCLTVPAFIWWMSHQAQHQRPALIPNSLWMNVPFTSVCLMLLLSFGVMQVFELLTSLYFQQVQHLSALSSSIRFLPSLIIGAGLNLTTGLIVHRTPAAMLVVCTSTLSAGSPLLMALIKTQWPYWYDAFPAQILEPLCVEVLFTVGLLVVSETFPTNTQALAGAVFTAIGQFGQAIGLALVSVISNAVTHKAQTDAGLMQPGAVELLEGYRAGFWTSFAWMCMSCFIGVVGLRKVGRVGLKRD